MALLLPEAAALLGQSLHQVWTLIRTARLPAKKVGGNGGCAERTSGVA
jgi:hypothetical protein